MQRDLSVFGGKRVYHSTVAEITSKESSKTSLSTVLVLQLLVVVSTPLPMPVFAIELHARANPPTNYIPCICAMAACIMAGFIPPIPPPPSIFSIILIIDGGG
jgi:hypothetical protein